VKKLSTITQFIVKLKGKKGGRWEAIWREKGERIEGRVSEVRLGREEERLEGRSQGRGRERRTQKSLSIFQTIPAGAYVSIQGSEEITADIQGP
jgi:hypothetical protein